MKQPQRRESVGKTGRCTQAHSQLVHCLPEPGSSCALRYKKRKAANLHFNPAEPTTAGEMLLHTQTPWD